MSVANAASLAEAPGSDGKLYELSADLVTLTDTRPGEAEAIRTVRTHIVARHLEDGRRGLAVCAPGAGQGVTYTSVNLAVSLSQVGVATLLIDANMRTPHLEEYIKPQAPTPGLKQCLTPGGPTAMECIHSEVLPNLSLLYAGGVAENAQELLAGDPFKRLIERCLRDFEFTIIDTPPTNGSADARRISTLVGYVIIVAKPHITRVNELSVLASQLQEDGARVIGSVLNEI